MPKREDIKKVLVIGSGPIVIGQAAGELSQWLNYIWIVVPVGVHTAAYVWGASIEKKRRQKVAEAQEFKQRRK